MSLLVNEAEVRNAAGSPTPAMKESGEERDLESAFESAATENNWGSGLIIFGIIAMLIGFGIALNSDSLRSIAISAAVAGPIFTLGLVCKIIARLDFIRAEIKAQKRP